MKRLCFENYEEFACEICDRYETIKDNDDLNDVAIIAKYEEIRQIIKELVFIGYDLHSISLEDIKYDGYDDEYILSLYDDELWCEKFRRESGYIIDESGVTYILDNCSSKVISRCEGEVIYEVCIEGCDEDDEYDYTCNERKCACKDSEKKPISDTVKSSYTVNGKSVTKEEFDKKYAEFEDKYMDNIRDMLLNYCDLMDRFNDWQKMFW